MTMLPDRGLAASRERAEGLRRWSRAAKHPSVEPSRRTIPTAAAEAGSCRDSAPSRVVGEDVIDRALQAVYPAHGSEGTRGTVEGVPGPIRGGTTMLCRFIPDEDVPDAHRSMIAGHVERAFRLSGFAGEIRIRWFRLADAPMVDDGFLYTATHDHAIPGGRFLLGSGDEPLTIDLNAGITGDLAVAAAVHETRHAAMRLLRALLENPQFREDEADNFVARYMEAERAG